MVISTRRSFDSGPRTSSPATRAPAPAQPQKPSSPLPASKRFDEMSTGKGGALRRAIGTKLGGTPAAPRQVTASSLLTESIGDGRANCLERAYAAAGTTDRVTLLQDRLDAVGHAVIEGRDGKVRDPVTGRSFASMDAYLVANPRYALRPEAQARGIPRSSLERIFSTAPGSPARHAAIASSGLASVGTVRVADVDPTAVTRATGEITGATSAYDAARSAVQAADQRMAEELALLGPSLTEDERNDFIAAFRADPRYADVYANEAAAAAHLESVLEQHRDTIEAYCDSTAYAHSRPETDGQLPGAGGALHRATTRGPRHESRGRGRLRHRPHPALPRPGPRSAGVRGVASERLRSRAHSWCAQSGLRGHAPVDADHREQARRVSWQTYLQQQREANMYQGNPLGYALSTAAQYAPAN